MVNWPDVINGTFELVGGGLLWMNVCQLHRDKKVSGVAVQPTAFWFAWGVWNLYLYPSVGLWLSALGAINIVVANGIWLGQMLYYRQRSTATLPAPQTSLPTAGPVTPALVSPLP